MKKILLLLIAILFFNIGSFAQNKKYNDIKNYILNLGYIIDENVNVFSDDLIENTVLYGYSEFYSGKEYILYAFSEDSNVTDIDLWLCYTNNEVYNKDVDSQNNAYIYFNPEYDCHMKTFAENYKSKTDDPSKCWLIIGYK